MVIGNKSFEDEGQVLAGCGGCWIFQIKDGATNSYVDNGTAELLSRDSYDYCIPSDSLEQTWFFQFRINQNTGAQDYFLQCILKPGKSDPSTVSVSVSKSGYQSKTAPINPTGSIVYLDKNPPPPTSSPPSSDSSTSSSDSSSTGTTTNTPVVAKETLSSVSLPSVLTKKGSKTTVLSKIKDLKKVSGFTLDIPGKNRIVFRDTLDLSSDKLVSIFKKLDTYVKISESGKVSLDSKTLAALNKKATITMSGLKFVTTPQVLIDGKKDTKKVVSNLVFDKKKGVLTFDVAHFSTLKASPKIEITSPVGNKVANPNTKITGTISDPDATLTIRFNEQDLEPISPDENGQFEIDNLTFREGENFLTIEAKSKLGKVLPLVTTITYQPQPATTALVGNQTNYPLLIVSLIATLAFLILLGYLVYRHRKHVAKPHPAVS